MVELGRRTGPKTLALSTLYLYKGWRAQRVEIKAGYITNDTEFVGIQVGGSLATGAQERVRCAAVQVGMSYRASRSRLPRSACASAAARRYVKIGAQLASTAAEGIATAARNPGGFQFAPAGDGLLLINELGYQRAASATTRQTWVRPATCATARSTRTVRQDGQELSASTARARRLPKLQPTSAPGVGRPVPRGGPR
ncbi:MAG: hypothetical protein U0599_01335 [Vicinamibacteria bacterium]